MFIDAFLDARYHDAGRTVPWIIGGYLLRAFFGIFQSSALQARRTQFIWFVSLTAFAANIGLNLAFIPRRGMEGAAYATFAAYGIEALIMYAYSQRLYRIPFSRWRVVVAMVAFGGVLLPTQLRFGSAAIRLSISAATMLEMLSMVAVLAKSEVQTIVRRVVAR